MGEIADMMIEGNMCPCGEYLGGGYGCPQYCSADCARDFGGFETGPAQAPELKPHECHKCGKRFRFEQALKQHVRAKHDQLACPYCTKVCKTIDGVNHHVAAKHPEIGHFNRLDEAAA